MTTPPLPQPKPPVTTNHPPNTPPSEQAAAGSGLLSELQLSPRTECAYPPSPQAPGPRGSVLALSPHKPLGALSPSSAFSALAPSVHARRRLWTAGRITALSAHGVRLPALPTSPGTARLRTRALPPQAPSEHALSPHAPFYYLLFTISHFPPSDQAPRTPNPCPNGTPNTSPEQRSGYHPAQARRSVGTPHTLHPTDSAHACRFSRCSRRSDPAIPAESGSQYHSQARSPQTHATASTTALDARRHNARRTQQKGVHQYSRGPASESRARKNPNGPTHHLSLAGHRPESLHSHQFPLESPGRPLTWNADHPGFATTSIITNAKTPWGAVADSIGSAIVNVRPSYPLNFRQLEGTILCRTPRL